MKLHKHLIQDIVLALKIVFEEKKYADKVIERAFKNHPKWGSRDRKFFAETVYDMVRYWRYLWFCLGQDVNFSEKNLEKLFSVYWLLFHNEMPSVPGLQIPDAELVRSQKEKATQNIAIQESYPDWICDLLKQELNEQYQSILKALNQKADVVLRCNRLKTDVKTLKARLHDEGIETEILGEKYPDALILKERKNVFTTKAFKDGLFEMQDGSSQLVAPFMKLEPGQRIVDACAGAGGKTLHIASLMKNKGKVIAMDVEEAKLLELKRRLRRSGVDIVEARVIDSNKVFKRLEKTADRVLLDVPCSGLGVLRRNPDTKWKLSLERINELRNIQSEILQNYSVMVKPGGYLIYSTCSLLPSENREQIEKFLEQNPKKWDLEEDLSLFPHRDRFDGFYMARLKRL